MIQIQPYLLSFFGTGDVAAQLLGFILSIGSLSAVLPLLLGFYADRYGRKIFIILGEVLSLLGLFGLSFADTHILIILVSTIIFNIGIGIHDPPLNALIYESSEKKRRGLAYAAVYNSSSIAGIIASLLILANSETYVIFFHIGCLIFIILIVLNLTFLKDIKSNVQKMTFPIKKVFEEPISRMTAIAFAIDSFSWGLPLAIANGIYILLFKVDVGFIATLTLVQTVILVLLQYPAGLFIDRFGRISGLIIGEIAGIIWIIYVHMAMTNQQNAEELLLIGYAILGISIAFWGPSVTLSFISLDPSNASTNFGILSFIQRLGWVPTAALAGFIYATIEETPLSMIFDNGFSPLLLVTFIGTLIVIVLFYRIDRIEKKNNSLNLNSRKS